MWLLVDLEDTPLSSYVMNCRLKLQCCTQMVLDTGQSLNKRANS